VIRRASLASGAVAALGALRIAAFMATRCQDSNDISAPSIIQTATSTQTPAPTLTPTPAPSFASLLGVYRADYFRPCPVQGSVVVLVTQIGSQVSTVIPGFGRVDGTAAPVGNLPRLSSSTLTLDQPLCGNPNPVLSYLPADDGRVLSWFIPYGRGETCSCGIGTLSISLVLTPQ
jgi:hypothetical protein